jgi:GT2 family glycosyltransferase
MSLPPTNDLRTSPPGRMKHGPRAVDRGETIARTSDSAPDVSVVICAYTPQRWDQLVQAMESVRRQITESDELILVVDHNDTLLARCRRAWPELRILANSDARGLSAARNRGVAAATRDVVVFMDDDAVAAAGWIDRMRRRYEEDALVMAVGGAVEPIWDRGRPSWFPEEFDWVVGCTFRGHPSSARSVRNVIGANMSFRRDVFQAAGRFRDDLGRVGRLPAGCEETELCIRARRACPERTIVHDPAIRVMHQVPSNRSGWRYFVSRCYSEGRSKARVSALVGTRDGLATERAYAMRTLPRGVVRGVADGMLRRDPAGFSRAAAIALGLATTAAGFAWEWLGAAAGATRRRLSASRT